jgi:alkanesulfonate monooxygenase SsuD/methylene tetrahydromethanopterin reductase-like flavin-dependent oxidoreductase (luciferase family)
VSDHLFLDIEKYGGGPGEYGAFDPIVTIAALARTVTTARLGTLVLCEALRPATVLAKALATLDQICGGRLDIGIGAGWYEPEYEAIGMKLPPPAERLERLEEALDVLAGLLGGGPFSYDGRFQHAVAAPNRPAAAQAPRPPLWIGGKGNRLLRLVAERADGWNTCWVWTPDDYRDRLAALERACARAGRDPSTVRRSLGLSTLVGADERDLDTRFRRNQDLAPNRMLAATTVDEFRTGRLVGTVEQVADQLHQWADLGVETLIVSLGPLPFSLYAGDDLELVAAAGTAANR